MQAYDILILVKWHWTSDLWADKIVNTHCFKALSCSNFDIPWVYAHNLDVSWMGGKG